MLKSPQSSRQQFNYTKYKIKNFSYKQGYPFYYDQDKKTYLQVSTHTQIAQWLSQYHQKINKKMTQYPFRYNKVQLSKSGEYVIKEKNFIKRRLTLDEFQFFKRLKQGDVYLKQHGIAIRDIKNYDNGRFYFSDTKGNKYKIKNQKAEYFLNFYFYEINIKEPKQKQTSQFGKNSQLEYDQQQKNQIPNKKQSQPQKIIQHKRPLKTSGQIYEDEVRDNDSYIDIQANSSQVKKLQGQIDKLDLDEASAAQEDLSGTKQFMRSILARKQNKNKLYNQIIDNYKRKISLLIQKMSQLKNQKNNLRKDKDQEIINLNAKYSKDLIAYHEIMNSHRLKIQKFQMFQQKSLQLQKTNTQLSQKFNKLLESHKNKLAKIQKDNSNNLKSITLERSERIADRKIQFIKDKQFLQEKRKIEQINNKKLNDLNSKIKLFQNKFNEIQSQKIQIQKKSNTKLEQLKKYKSFLVQLCETISKENNKNIIPKELSKEIKQILKQNKNLQEEKNIMQLETQKLKIRINDEKDKFELSRCNLKFKYEQQQQKYLKEVSRLSKILDEKDKTIIDKNQTIDKIDKEIQYEKKNLKERDELIQKTFYKKKILLKKIGQKDIQLEEIKKANAKIIVQSQNKEKQYKKSMIVINQNHQQQIQKLQNLTKERQAKIESLIIQNESLSKDIQRLKDEQKVKIDRASFTTNTSMITEEPQQQCKFKEFNQNYVQEQIEKAKEQIINEIIQFLQNKFGEVAQERSLKGILHFLDKEKETIEIKSTFLQTSSILSSQTACKLFLQELSDQTLRVSTKKTTLLYRYDQFNKGFGKYLSQINGFYPFMVIVKIQQGNIFGFMTEGLPRFEFTSPQVICFNANSNKSFTKNQKTEVNSIKFESGWLILGNGEVKFRNNSSELIINTRIFGKRYFKFSNEQFTGTSENKLSVESMEIFKLQID